MITLNLLPDLVLQRRRDAQTKKLALIGMISWGALLLLVILGTFTYELIEKSSLASATAAKSDLNKVVNSDDMVKFRTEAIEVQTSLKSLDALFNKQTKMSQVNDRLASLTPKTVILTSVNISNSQAITVSGSASSYDEVGKFVVALKNQSPELADGKIGFTEVKLQSANLGDKGSVKFSLSTKYTLPDPSIGVSK